MTKHTVKGAGGFRKNAKRPLKYGEKTVTVFGKRVPKSKEKEYRTLYIEKCEPILNEVLKTWEITPDKKEE